MCFMTFLDVTMMFNQWSKFSWHIRSHVPSMSKENHSTYFHSLIHVPGSPPPSHQHYLALQDPNMWIQKDFRPSTAIYLPHPCQCLLSIWRASLCLSFLSTHIGWWHQRWLMPNGHLALSTSWQRRSSYTPSTPSSSSDFPESRTIHRRWHSLRAEKRFEKIELFSLFLRRKRLSSGKRGFWGPISH